jgi:hypothetical protein
MLHSDPNLIESQESLLIRAAMLDLINGDDDAAGMKILAALKLMKQQLNAIASSRAQRREQD